MSGIDLHPKMGKKKYQMKKNPKAGYTTWSSKVKGDEESLGNYVFDYGQQGKMNQYNKTFEAIISYIGRTYSQPGNAISSLRAVRMIDIADPPTLNYQNDTTGDDDAKAAARIHNRMADLNFTEALKESKKKISMLENNIQASYSLVWGQCTLAMQAQLKTGTSFMATREDFDVFSLLKEIKGYTFKLTDRDYPYQSVWDSYISVFNLKQGKDEYLDKFQERFNVLVEAAEGYGCEFGREKVLWNTDPVYSTLSPSEKQDPDHQKDVSKACRERLLAYGFISALSDRFDRYKKDLKASYSQNNNKYKETVVGSYQMALDVMRIYQAKRWKPKEKSKKNKEEEEEEEEEKKGVSFVNETQDKKCFKCAAPDFRTCACDNLKKFKDKEKSKGKKKVTIQEEGNQHLSIAEEDESESSCEGEALGFNTIAEAIVDAGDNSTLQDYCTKVRPKDLKNVILIDSGSTVDLFKSKRYLTGIHKTNSKCKSRTNGGVVYATKKGTLQGYGEVWYHPVAITNLLSFSKVRDKYMTQYDSFKEDSFLVHKPEGIRRLINVADGLYALKEEETENITMSYLFLEIVEENKAKFTSRMIKGAEKAKDLYGKVQYPSIKDFKHMVRFGFNKKCPVTVEDIDTMVRVWGPNNAVLQGKTVRFSSPPVSSNPDYISIPFEVHTIRRKLIMEGGIIYVNKIMFWFTLTRKLQFITIERVKD